MKRNFDKGGAYLSPQCPYCYDGEIIYLRENEVFICNKCRRRVKVSGHID